MEKDNNFRAKWKVLLDETFDTLRKERNGEISTKEAQNILIRIDKDLDELDTDNNVSAKGMEKDSSVSPERIKWLKEVAWHLARVTRKYDRLSLEHELSHEEYMLLLDFEIEETHRYVEEIKRKIEEEKKEHDKYIRSLKKDRASSSVKFLFPIGEA